MDFKGQEVLDFETVIFNSTIEKHYEIKNDSSLSKTYKVEKYSDNVRILDSGFKVWPNVSHPIKPGSVFKIYVSFTPKVLNTKCSDYLVIKPSFGEDTVVLLKAISESGVNCSLSTTLLKISCSSDQMKSSKKITLANIGVSVANFNFFLDREYSEISLSPAQGKIAASKCISITATYTPIRKDPFFKRLFCLIENHKPLALDIYGIISKSKDAVSFPRVKEIPLTFTDNYLWFMNNVMNKVAINEVPLVSVSKSNVDFGHCFPKREKSENFSLTNNSNMKVLVKWNDNVVHSFQIRPYKLELDVHSSVAFTVTFKPSSKDKLFNAYLEAQLASTDYVLPFTVEICLKGHSFDELSCGWAAQYKIVPHQILLPPCMPEPLTPSHSTLTIYRHGHLPLAFKFHPPTNTNFVVKPQQGLIREHFELIVVQFNPTEVNDAVYHEKWMISFNSNQIANHCYVDFLGSVETPEIIINQGKTVIFPKVHPRSPIEILVDFYNPTRLTFWYSECVLKGESILMTGSGGEIWPYEHKQVAWSFCPQGVGEMEALVLCAPVMKANVKFKSTTVVVKGTCEKTDLQVTPHGLIYQGVLRGCEHERGFEITNVGEAFISGSLVWLPNENCSPNDIEANFIPETFTIFPGSSVLISVNITPVTSGSKGILIGYSTNDDMSGTPLLPAYINSVFPCLRISDIRINNSGPLFTKLDFWKTLQVDKVNEILSSLHTSESKEMTMYFPSFVNTSDNIIVELLLENHSDIGIFLTLNWEKSCDCKPVLTTVSFSRSEWQDLCPHKTQVQISPSKTYIGLGEITILKVQVSYSTVGYVENVFNVTIAPEDYESNDCLIELCVGRSSIPEGVPYIDNTDTKQTDHFVFQFKSVFIGDCFPFVQGFNLYNNTKQSVCYEINDKSLINTPFKYVGRRNTISPLSNHVLLFTFLPNRCGLFEAEVEFLIDHYPTTLVLKGHGISVKGSENHTVLLPEVELLNIIDPSPVFLSTCHVNAGPMLPTCSQRHVFYLNNKTNDLISFKWHTTKIPDVMELRVYPAKGAVQPRDLLECRLFVYSRGRPCHVTSSVTCVFASFTKYAKMAKAIHKYRKDAVTCADYFIITEDGTETVDLAPPKEDWPRKGYLTLSVDLEVKSDAVQDGTCLLPYTPSVIQTSLVRDSLVCESDQNRLFIGQVLEIILLEALYDLKEKAVNIDKPEPVKRYTQIKDLSTHNDVPVPRQVTQFAIEELLHTVWQDMFRMEPRNSTERLRRTLIYQLQHESTSEDSIMKIPLVQARSGSFESHSS